MVDSDGTRNNLGFSAGTRSHAEILANPATDSLRAVTGIVPEFRHSSLRLLSLKFHRDYTDLGKVTQATTPLLRRTPAARTKDGHRRRHFDVSGSLGLPRDAVSQRTHSAALLPKPFARGGLGSTRIPGRAAPELGLLLGPSGTGKSLILDRLAGNLRHRGLQVANLSLLGVDLHEFLWLLAAELGLNPDRKENTFSLWRNPDRPDRRESLSTVGHGHSVGRRRPSHARGARPPRATDPVGSGLAHVAGPRASISRRKRRSHRISAARTGRTADRSRAVGRSPTRADI